MQQNETLSLPERLRADVAGLSGVHGTMLLRVQGKDIGALDVDDRRAEYLAAGKQGSVVAEFSDPADLRRLLRGELNPVVASLQQRLAMSGDIALGARIILGLTTGAAFEPVEKA